jgi:putative component of toxin-antitoxin plasmid stabilization module
LKDIRARARILVRIERLASGNPGDVRTGFKTYLRQS